MSSKKILFVVLGIFIFVCLMLGVINYSTQNYAENYVATVNMDSAGNITVNETIIINFKSYQNYIYRDLSTSKNFSNNPLLNGLNYEKNKGELVTSTVNVQVYEGDIVSGDATDITNQCKIGYSYLNSKDRHGEDVKCLCDESFCPESCESIYVDAGSGKFEGVFSFSFQYEIDGMATKYLDCAELNYRMFDYLGFKTKKATVSVNIPNSMISENDLLGYVHSVANGSYKQINNKGFEINAKNIGPEDMLEFRIIFPTEIVNKIDSENTISAQMKEKIINYEEEVSRTSKLLHTLYIFTTVITVIICLGLVIVTIIVYKKYDKEFTPKFDNEYYRELPSNYPPAVMSYLYYFQKTVDEDFTATILNLVRRKYLTLTCLGDMSSKDCDYEMKLTDKDINNLMAHEKSLINFIINVIGDGTKVTFDEIESYGDSIKNANNFTKESQKFKKEIINDCKNFDFFIDTKKAKAKVYVYGVIGFILGLLLGIIGLGIGLPVPLHSFFICALSLVYILYVASIKKRSINGNEEYAKWKAFKHFLCDFGQLGEYSVLGLDMWEEYLVYATSLKVADKVMEQLKVKLPEMATDNATFLYTTPGERMYNFYMYNRLSRTYVNLRNTSYGTIAQHNAKNFGSSGGHGGGFSGGSSFGGGGGGFRSGR